MTFCLQSAISDSQGYPPNLILFEARNAQVTFAEKPQMKINSFQKRKHGNIIHTSIEHITLLMYECHF